MITYLYYTKCKEKKLHFSAFQIMIVCSLDTICVLCVCVIYIYMYFSPGEDVTSVHVQTEAIPTVDVGVQSEDGNGPCSCRGRQRMNASDYVSFHSNCVRTSAIVL